MAQMGRLGWLVVLACLVSTLAFSTISPASPWPPPAGGWTIEVGEDVTLDGQDLTLPGSVIVYGHLTLNGCTLRFSPTSDFLDLGVWLKGTGLLDATDTTLTSATDLPACLRTDDSSLTNLIRCTLNQVVVSYSGASTNTCTGCSINPNTPKNHLFDGTSTNVLTDTIFGHNDCVQFSGASRNTLTRCTLTMAYHGGSAGGSSLFDGCTVFSLDAAWPSVTVVQDSTLRFLCLRVSSTALNVADLRPGYSESNLLRSSDGAFCVDLLRTALEGGAALMYNAGSSGVVERSTLRLWVDNREGSPAQVAVIESEIVGLEVDTYAPASTTVAGFRDGETPQTVNITSSNTAFSLSLTDTVVNESYWFFVNWGAPVPGESTITDSVVGGLEVRNTYTVQARDSTFTQGVYLIHYSSEGAEGFAYFSADNSTLAHLMTMGTGGTALLRRTTVSAGVTLNGDWSAPQLPVTSTLTCHEASFTGGPINVGDDSVHATLQGTIAIAPSVSVGLWVPGAKITRRYPVQVVDGEGAPVQGAVVWVTDAGGEVVWEGVTDGEGYAYPEITFDQYNYDAEFRVRAWYPGWYAGAPVRFLSSTPIVLTPTGNTLAFTSFERERYPWTAFAAGPGEGVSWRQLGGTGGLPFAHSGDYLMAAQVSGEAITGLRLDLPTTPTGPVPSDYALRTWTYVDAATVGTSSYFGFVLVEDCLTPTSAWSGVGWEPYSAAASRLWVADTAQELPFGLTAGRWHLVQVKYHRVAQTVTLWLNGMLAHEADASSLVGQAVNYAVMGALSSLGSSREVCFDDTSLTVGWPSDAPPPGECTHPYASLEGPEQVLSGQDRDYTLTYGNGYPVLGVGSFPAPEGQKVRVGVSLPADYTLVSADPAPSRMVNNTPVWELDPPELGNEGEILLTWQTPGGLASEGIDRVLAWATTNPAAMTTDPPNPPDWTYPWDDTWGWPKDLLPQRILTFDQQLPDLWVKKQGPATASPGDTVNYVITVGNCGYADAQDVTLKDRLPEAMGGGDRVVVNLAELPAGDRWRGLLSANLPWGVPGGTLLLNRAYVPTGAAELDYSNNEALWETTVQAAHDPNQITVSPSGGVDRHDLLIYTVECENTGAGTAYGVHVMSELDPQLDDATLELAEGMAYDPSSRMILWEVGTLTAGQGASASVTVQVAGTARRARPIIAQATVYFPSVPEETPTNIVANIVNGTFPDVTCDHWAILDIERIFEAGLATGYPNGTYQPQISVSRAQMAIYIARALADGDANIPTGPPTPTFADVTQDPADPYSVCYDHVEYAVANEIVFGYPDGLYHPDVPVDRGQMAIFVARAIAGGDSNVPAGPPTPTFPDVTTDPANPYHVCYDHVEHIANWGVTGGYPDGTYRPTYVCTRDLMAAYMARAFRLPM